MRRNVSRSGLARRERHQRYQIKHWCDRLVDVPAFIIGNAPSLNDHNLLLLKDYFTIGINRSFYALDPTILIWQDVQLWNTEYHRLHNTQAIKVARDIADPRRIYYNFYLKGGPYKFEQPPKCHILHGRGSTGPVAVQLAVAMGCRPIVLLGMDCKKGAKGETDFYGVNPHHRPHTLDNCELGLRFLREKCPVEIRNVSSGTEDLWPVEDLKDVIVDVDPQRKFFRGRQSLVKQILRTV
jgi:hypothetical protein